MACFMVAALSALGAGCTPYVPPPSPAAAISRPPASYAARPGAAASSSAAAGVLPPGAVHYHRVVVGETLWSIARRFGTDVETLAWFNRLRDPSKLKAGQRLAIPSSQFSSRDVPRFPRSFRPEESREARSGAPSHRTPRGASSAARVAPARPGSSERFGWPVVGNVISIFGMRREGTLNKGVDIQAEEGAEVRAARSGTVSYIHEDLPGFGKTVIIDHGDGFASVYAYVGQILVRSGQRVLKQEVIARVGQTGRLKVAALHFEIRRNQKPEDPLRYLP